MKNLVMEDKTNIRELQAGVYKVPDGKVAVVDGGLVIVRDSRAKYKHSSEPCHVCKECRHHGVGRAYSSSNLQTGVCFLRRKNSKQVIYSVRHDFEYACGAFEPKETSDK